MLLWLVQFMINNFLAIIRPKSFIQIKLIQIWKIAMWNQDLILKTRSLSQIAKKGIFKSLTVLFRLLFDKLGPGIYLNLNSSIGFKFC